MILVEKLQQHQTFTVKDPNDGTETKKSYMPVPYNMQFELAIMSKLNDDALQIVEQILPYFQPAYNVTVELVEALQEKRDIPVVLENITMQDDYEGDFTSRRVLLYTLRFTAKTYLFGPASAATKDIIKKAQSVISLERILQMPPEKKLTLSNQEQSRTTLETQQQHWQKILQKQKQHSTLPMLVVLPKKLMLTLMERKSSSRR